MEMETKLAVNKKEKENKKWELLLQKPFRIINRINAHKHINTQPHIQKKEKKQRLENIQIDSDFQFRSDKIPISSAKQQLICSKSAMSSVNNNLMITNRVIETQIIRDCNIVIGRKHEFKSCRNDR